MAESKDIKTLIQILKDRNLPYGERKAAAKALGETGDENAVEPLIKALSDGSESVRAEARHSLINIGVSALEPLLHALESRGQRMRREVVLVLRDGSFTDERALGSLIRALKDKNDFVRSLSAQVIGNIGSPRALEPLIEALRDNPADHSISEALGKLGLSAVESLIELLQDETWQIRSHAAEDLGKIKDSRAVESLTEALQDENEYVRSSAVDALGAIKDAKAVESLIQAMGIVDPNVRESAIKVLVNVGSRGMNALIQALGDLDRDVQNGTAEVLRKIGEPAVESLIQELNAKSQRVRVGVAWLLGEMGDERAKEPLLQVLNDEDKEVQATANKALKKIARKASQ